jgi:hypothetical protein
MLNNIMSCLSLCVLLRRLLYTGFRPFSPTHGTQRPPSCNHAMQPMPSGQSGLIQDASIVHSQPLHDRQIRVLVLQHGRGDDPLACQLRVVDVLDNNISFEAISYAWGSQETPERILCTIGKGQGQVSLPLTRNAADALKAFRKPRGKRLLWIDSICISQTSQSEKSTQVGMMDSIFASATAVLIWLGREDGVRSPAAAALFKRWADWSRFATVMAKQEMLSRPRRDGVHITRLGRWHGPLEFFDDDIRKILEVFECEWFWRLWCVQELALARKAFVCWGSVRLTWETISDLAVHVQARHASTLAQSGLSGVPNVHMLERLRSQVRGEARESVSFSRLLSLTRAHGVTEHRDRIFSLLGLDRKMHSAASVVMGPEELFVTPDYSQQLEEVYFTVAKKLLIREGNLHLLSFVQHEDVIATGSLPSWVPQWHINVHRLITQFDLISGHPVNLALNAAFENSNSSSDTPVDGPRIAGQSFHILDDGTLQAKGLLCDTVAQKSDSSPSMPYFEEHWIQTLRQWLRNVTAWLEPGLRQNKPHISSSQLVHIAFCVFYRTLFGGHLNIKQVFTALRNELPAFRRLLYSDGNEEFASFPTTREVVIGMCRSRTLFLTDRGKVGIGPHHLQPGDSICLLSGAAVPLLMRPRPQDPLRCLLVGEAYVNGLAYASNDYEIAEDFEALHVNLNPYELRRFIAGSKSRVHGDLERELTHLRNDSERQRRLSSNIGTRLESSQQWRVRHRWQVRRSESICRVRLSKYICRVIFLVVGLTNAPQRKMRFCWILLRRRRLLGELMSG